MMSSQDGGRGYPGLLGSDTNNPQRKSLTLTFQCRKHPAAAFYSHLVVTVTVTGNDNKCAGGSLLI